MAVSLHFADVFGQSDFNRLPDELRAFWNAMRFDLLDADSQVQASLYPLGDWWFCAVDLKGSIRISARPRAAPDGLSSYANLSIMLSGRKRAVAGDPKLPMRAGEIALEQNVIREVNREDAIILSGELRYLEIHVPRDALDGVAAGRSLAYAEPRSAFRGAASIVVAIARSLVSEIGRCPEAELLGLLDPFARAIVEAFQADVRPEEKRVSMPARRANLIVSYLQAHLWDTDLTPQRTARECGVSVRQLNRLFQAQGTSYQTALRALRLDEAAARLASPGDTDLSLGRIAGECGFASSSHFSRAFKRAYEMSPSAYRRERMGSGYSLSA